MEDWRYYFYFIFGLLPTVFFSLRVLIQWINSEKKKTSWVNSTFWYLSLCGNALASAHYFIQVQFLLMLIQVSNGFISWRNLDLLSGSRKSFKTSIFILIALVVSASALFFAQFLFIEAPIGFLEIPFGLSKNGVRDVSIFWHIVGGIGCMVFASRFWVQWWDAEKSKVSKLGKAFWFTSIIGSVIALIYFLRIHDWVSSLNYSFGLIPYIRNLILMGRKRVA